jgi:hypothetical protein
MYTTFEFIGVPSPQPALFSGVFVVSPATEMTVSSASDFSVLSSVYDV